MFDLNKWLSCQPDYDDALLLSKNSATLSYRNTVLHKLKWGLNQQDDYFLQREAVWTGRAEGSHFLSQRILYEGEALLLIEFIDGVSLSELLKSESHSYHAAFQCIPFVESLFYELDALHQKGIVHGDVKASNVIVTPEGTARFIDYAAANWVGSSNDSKPYLMKTASYALPEYYTQPNVVTLVDWYAFFIIFDLVKKMTPVTLRSSTLVDYVSYHQQQLFMLPIDDVMKSKLLVLLDEFSLHFKA